VRISGGEHRGRVLAVPAEARPTEGRVREALFSIWGGRVRGCRFLDLFAGSGVVGLEAASRGAHRVVFVESDPRALRALGANLRRVAAERVEVRRGGLPAEAERLAAAGERFDLIFADPPYRYPRYPALLTAIAPLLAPGGEAAVEHATRESMATAGGGLVRVDERRYGGSALSFYRRGGQAAEA
jgi:16S rRNA (guanine(966)-N(2))-methyltransferase RsmD